MLSEFNCYPLVKIRIVPCASVETRTKALTVKATHEPRNFQKGAHDEVWLLL